MCSSIILRVVRRSPSFCGGWRVPMTLTFSNSVPLSGSAAHVGNAAEMSMGRMQSLKDVFILYIFD